MKHILIAGAAGFLGSHMAEHLLSLGHKVICVDRHNDLPFIKERRAELCLHDVIKPLPDFKAKIDYVLHFASCASPKDFMKDPIDALYSNSIGTQNLLDMAKDKSAIFFFPSSSQVYSELDPCASRAVYAQAKRYAEALIFANEYKKVKIARMFNVYGPGMRLDDGRVIPTFIVKALKNENIMILGGRQRVSFTYVDDIIDGLTRFIFDGGSFVEYGNPSQVTIRELARGIVKLTGSKSKVIIEEADFSSERLPDLHIAKELGWKPKASLEEGLTRTIEDFRKRL